MTVFKNYDHYSTVALVMSCLLVNLLVVTLKSNLSEFCQKS